MADEQRLILIAGTFDMLPDDHGSKWWQLGSGFATWLQANTPPTVRLMSEGELFRWSGLNSERERRLGGLALLDYLEELERRGIKYHILAHSHGGSVAWEALRELCRRSEQIPPGQRDRLGHLPGLLSLTTVGTPFMHYERKARVFEVPGLASGMAGLYLLLALSTLIYFALSLGGLIFDPGTLLFFGDRADPFTGEDWLRVLLAYTPLLALATGIALGLAGITAEAQQVLRDERLNRLAIERFGPRMRQFWSELDEAIHGLAHTIHTKLEVIPELRLGRTAYVADQLAFFSAPAKRMVMGPINAIARPAINAFIARQVRRALQGADRPFSHLAWVTPGPDRLRTPPPLPVAIDEDLRRDADIAAMAIPPAIREDVARLAGSPTSVMKFLGEVALEFSPRALIHTGYFENPQFRELIARHLTECARRASAAAGSPTPPAPPTKPAEVAEAPA